jgi:hypothetical protein
VLLPWPSPAGEGNVVFRVGCVSEALVCECGGFVGILTCANGKASARAGIEELRFQISRNGIMRFVDAQSWSALRSCGDSHK